MKNKLIFGAVAALTIFSLASCKSSSSEDYNIVRSDSEVLASVDAVFGTTFVDDEGVCQGSILDDSEKSGTTYYNIYASAADATSSLFVYNYDLSEYFKENGSRNRNLAINTLSYLDPDDIYSTEQTAILTAAYATTNGVSAKLPDVTFTVNTATTWSRTYSTTKAYSKYAEGADVSISIVYMPVYVEHIYAAKKTLKAYVFLPVYSVFTTSDGLELQGSEWVATTIPSTLKTIDLGEWLDEDGFDSTKIYAATTAE